MAIVPFDAYALATGFKVPSGLSSWFLKADGSIDTNGDISSTGIDSVNNFRLLTTAIYKF